jgi:hypothetical protein
MNENKEQIPANSSSSLIPHPSALIPLPTLPRLVYTPSAPKIFKRSVLLIALRG